MSKRRNDKIKGRGNGGRRESPIKIGGDMERWRKKGE